MVLLAACVIASKPRIALRPTAGRITPALSQLSDDDSKAKALFIDGRDTGLRIPPDAEAKALRNVRGDIAGTVEVTRSGAITHFYSRAFVKPRGATARVLPRPGGFDATVLLGIDPKGRALLLGLDAFPTHAIEDPFYSVSHAWLWQDGKMVDLGASDGAHFEAGGSVFGRFTMNPKGQAINNATQAVEKFSATFRWKDGKRTESKRLR